MCLTRNCAAAQHPAVSDFTECAQAHPECAGRAGVVACVRQARVVGALRGRHPRVRAARVEAPREAHRRRAHLEHAVVLRAQPGGQHTVTARPMAAAPTKRVTAHKGACCPQFFIRSRSWRPPFAAPLLLALPSPACVLACHSRRQAAASKPSSKQHMRKGNEAAGAKAKNCLDCLQAQKAGSIILRKATQESSGAWKKG